MEPPTKRIKQTPIPARTPNDTFDTLPMELIKMIFDTLPPTRAVLYFFGVDLRYPELVAGHWKLKKPIRGDTIIRRLRADGYCRLCGSVKRVIIGGCRTGRYRINHVCVMCVIEACERWKGYMKITNNWNDLLYRVRYLEGWPLLCRPFELCAYFAFYCCWHTNSACRIFADFAYGIEYRQGPMIEMYPAMLTHIIANIDVKPKLLALCEKIIKEENLSDTPDSKYNF